MRGVENEGRHEEKIARGTFTCLCGEIAVLGPWLPGRFLGRALE